MRSREPTRLRKLALLVCFVALTSAACGTGDSTGSGEAPREAYEGQTVTFTVPFSPGGGFDSYARLLAPYLEEELGATVVVENRPGAGGLVAVNHLMSSEPDGLTIGIMQPEAIAAAVVQEASGAEAIELDRLTYLANLGDSDYVWVAGAESGLESVTDATAEPFTFTSTGLGSPQYITEHVLVRALDIDGGEVLSGFESSEEAELAVVRGDADGTVAPVGSLAEGINSDDLVPLVRYGEKRSEVIPDAPSVLELDLRPADRELIEMDIQRKQYFRVIAAPPEVPDGRADFLSSALERVAANEEFRQKAEELQIPIRYTDGDEVANAVKEFLDPPEQYRQLLLDIAGG